MAATDIIDVSIGGNSEAIEAAFKKVMELGKGLGAGLEAIGAPLAGVLGVALGGATVASLVALGVQATKLGKEISDLSAQTGLTIDEFETLAYLARENGSNADQASKAVIKLRDALAQAESGSTTARAAFAAVGINWRELVNIPLGDALLVVAKAMATAETGTREFGALTDLMGSKNLPALQIALKTLGTEGWENAGTKATEAGQKMGKQVVKDLSEADQAIEDLTRKIRIFVGKDVIGTWVDFFSDTRAVDEWNYKVREAATGLSLAISDFKDGADNFDELENNIIDFVNLLLDAKGKVRESDVEMAEKGLAIQRDYYEKRGMLVGENQRAIEASEQMIAELRKRVTTEAVADAEKAADAAVKAEERATEAADLRGRMVGETLRNLADERVKPLLDLMQKIGTAIPEDGAKPIELYNQTMAYLNELLKDGKINQEQFAGAANLAADALAKATTQRTPAETLQETLRKLKVEFDQGQMSAEAYAYAVEAANAKFITQRTAGEALAETYRKLGQELANGQMSQEAYNRAMDEATEKARTVKTPLEAYNAKVNELNYLYKEGVISQDAYTRGLEDANSSLRSIKDPIEAYNDKLRDLKRLADDGAISQAALAKATRDADEALGAAALNELNRQIGITSAGGNEHEAARAQDYINQAREAAARGTAEGDRQAQWLIDQANKITGGGSTLEEVLGRGAGGGGGTTSSTPNLKDSEGRDPWDLGYTGPADQTGNTQPGDKTGAGANLTADAAAIVNQLKAIANKLGVFA